MNGSGVFLLRNSLLVAFDNRRLFVVRERIQLVVGDARRLGLILVERHSLVAVLQFLDLQRVRGIVHQYGRIAADIHEMDHVFFDILVERADFAVPAQPLGIGAERFNHKARPRLGVKSGAGSPRGHETAAQPGQERDAVHRQHTVHGLNPERGGSDSSGGAIHGNRADKAHKGKKKLFHSVRKVLSVTCRSWGHSRTRL